MARPSRVRVALLRLGLTCLGVCVVATPFVSSAPAAAQAATTTAPAISDLPPQKAKKPPIKPKRDPYGSPLDTLMTTHIWADVPAAQPFVDKTRPDPKNLEYAPLTGVDPVRPKPRNPPGVAALQAELEASGARNAARAKGFEPPAQATRRSRKPKPVAARE